MKTPKVEPVEETTEQKQQRQRVEADHLRTLQESTRRRTNLLGRFRNPSVSIARAY